MRLSIRISWIRVFAEGAIIVASVLLAFAIQAWWEGTKERAEVKRALVAIQAELQSNVVEIDEELAYRNAANDNIQSIFDAAGNSGALSIGEVDEMLAYTVWWGDVDFASGALNGLIQSGRLPIVQNESIRQRLATLPTHYAWTDRIERQTYESMRDVLVPYLIENTFFPQIASHWTAGRPGGGGTEQGPVSYPKGPGSDHGMTLQDSVFLGILVLRRADHDDAITSYSRLRPLLTGLIEDIEGEIVR